MQHKYIGLEVKEAGDDGTVAGYGSVFGNADLGGDIMEPGAFAESLDKEMPLMLWSHDFGTPPIGKWLKATEDSHGLYLEGKLFTGASEQINTIHRGLKEKAITGLSIGYYPIVHEWDEENETRKLIKVALKEVSFVNFPMNEEARVEQVKSALERGLLPTAKEFEAVLRDVGFSRQQAKRIVALGYRGLGARDAMHEDVEVDFGPSFRSMFEALRS